MVTLIIVLLLILAFRYGLKRGLLMTLLSVAGYVVIFLLAVFLAKPMGTALASIMPALFKNAFFSGMFYNVLSFWIIAIAGSIIYRFLARTVNGITKLPLISQVNALAGAALSTVLMYVVIFFALLLMSSWPSQNVRATVQQSTVAEWMLKKTPLISQQIMNDYNDHNQF